MRARFMNRISTLAIAATLAIAGVSAADPARATSVSFDFMDGCTSLCGTNYSSSYDGNTRTFTGSDGETTVTAQAWGRTTDWTNDTFETGFLGHYSHGLGVTDQDEDGGNSSHTVDNVSRLDFIVFHFSTNVHLTDVYLSAFQASGVSDDPDTDISVWFGNADSLADVGVDGKTLGEINTMYAGRVDDSGPNGQSTRTAHVGDDTGIGNVLIIGGSVSDTSPEDLIKIGLLSVDITPTTPHEEQVPEPASGLILLSGLAGLWFARRRRAARIARA